MNASASTMDLTGDPLILQDDTSAIVDPVVYESASTTGTDWSGAGVEPYDQGSFFPATFTETAAITCAVAPDNLYETVLAEIDKATESIYYEGYTFDHANLAAHLAGAIVARMAANPGMTVTVLLEGEPVGGIDDQEKWVCRQIEDAGGQAYLLYNDDASGVHGRHDLDPAHHRDLFRWTAGDPAYGAPPAGFTPDYTSGGTTYAVRFPAPFVVSGTFALEMVQSPENSLRDVDSLLGMVARAGSGDAVLVEQLYECPFWGPTGSNPTDDPNPRLEAYIAAARRGARVRLLLDSAYDDPGDVRSNTATCACVNGIATSESLVLSPGQPDGHRHSQQDGAGVGWRAGIRAHGEHQRLGERVEEQSGDGGAGRVYPGLQLPGRSVLARLAGS